MDAREQERFHTIFQQIGGELRGHQKRMEASTTAMRTKVVRWIENAQSRGYPVQDACGLIGISRNTFYLWKKELERIENNGN